MASRWLALGGAVLLGAGVGAWSLGRAQGPRLVRLEWDRTLHVEKAAGIPGEGWRDDLPAGAKTLQCAPKFHHHERVRKGTAQRNVTVEQGGKPVTRLETFATFDETPVEKDWCAWETPHWDLARAEHLGGEGPTARWPEPKLGEGERPGARTERYRAVFEQAGKRLVWEATTPEVWEKLEVGRAYAVKVEGEKVLSVER